MRRDVDKFFSNQGWIVDGSVDSDMIFCYNKSKIKEPLQIKIGHKEIFDCDMKSYSQYKMLLRHILCDMIYRYFMHFLLTWNKVIHSVMFKVSLHTFTASVKKDVFRKFIYKLNCRGNTDVVSNTLNLGGKWCRKKSKSTKKRWAANQPTQVIRNVVELKHVVFKAPSVRVDQQPAYPLLCQG